jgi:electron transfer flavoprotein alpha/beta subunit
MKSKKAEIAAWGAADIGADENRTGRNGSPTWVVKIFFPERNTKAEMLDGSPEEQVESLVGKLKSDRLV